MNLGELIDGLEAVRRAHGSGALVMALDPDNPIPHSIKSINPERHDDGDGPVTVWLSVEET